MSDRNPFRVTTALGTVLRYCPTREKAAEYITGAHAGGHTGGLYIEQQDPITWWWNTVHHERAPK